MSVTILICKCGERVRAPGAKPGRVGRCPRCGNRLQVPALTGTNGHGANKAQAQKNTPDAHAPAMAGYQVEPEFGKLPAKRKREPASDELGSTARRGPSGKAAPMADGILPVLVRLEGNWFASFLYPLRSFECLSVIAILSVVFWLFVILIPEYCRAVMGDAESMGAPTIGKFIALVSILPVAFLLPFGIFYWLKYLGRVLVCSAMGDTIPPRTPDRNFDGFFTGLSPWFVWLALGCSVGLLPLLLYRSSHSSADPWNWPLAALCFVAGFPYMVMALLMSFLHDNALAAKPFSVISAMLGLGGSFLLLCAFIVAIASLNAAILAFALKLRPSRFSIYITLGLVFWFGIQWCSIVMMRVLGTYYYQRRESLAWHHERPRWGAEWKL